MKSTSLLAAGTLMSRVLGFCRDVLLARLLGTGLRADAFFVAFKIPNLFRDLVGEGAAQSAVVPVFSEYREHKPREAFWQFVSVLLVWALIVLSGVTLLGIGLAPFLVRLLAPGFMAEAGKLDLTIRLTRLLFPYLILIGLTAYSIAILFTFRSFAAPAFSPCLLNVAIIAGVLLAPYFPEPLGVLAAAVLIGGVLQLAVQGPSLRRHGFHFVWPRQWRHPGVLQIGRLLIPRCLGAGVYQLTVLIDTFCASLSSIVGSGGIAAIYYANRIVQFPMGIFTVALASAVLPSLSGLAARKNWDHLKATLVFSLENIFFVMFPSSIMLILLSTPIIRVLFERGHFDAYSTAITSMALLFYALGLFSFGGIKILVTAFHALQDTRTPVMVAAGCLLVNAVLNVVLMFPLKIGGIALASSLAATLDFFILFHLLERRLGGLNSGFRVFVFKVLVASFLAGAVVAWLWMKWAWAFEPVKLAVVGLSGGLVYGGLCLMLKVPTAVKAVDWIQRHARLE